ncbi:MAG: flagellar motor switch protein FliG [Candidatus Eremiobacteraeota bacterium]|nr:flagellar motor switch protein FliG [Candidatus Eremiobacteraeota bacterium]
MTTSSLSAKQKAAILLVSLPPDVSAQIFKEFGPEEVQAISLEISKLPQISQDMRAKVIEEFLTTSDIPGLREQAAQMGSFPTQAVPAAATRRVGGGFTTRDTRGGARQRPLDFLRNVDPRQLLALVRKEHPQTIALVLSHLQASQASAVISELPSHMQTEVARRLAEIGRIAPEVIQEVEKVLESRLYSIVEGEAFGDADGKEALVEILSQSDRSTEEKIITGLTKKSPHLASDIKNKLCDFEDLNNIDDNSLQQVLRLTDIRDLVLALKGANRELSERIYNCMTPEVSKALRDDVDSLGSVPWEEIKAAQQQIRNILRGLVTLGKVKFR